MAKLIAISTIFLISLSVLVAEASFRASINTIVEGENNQWEGGQQRCQQQIQQKRQQLRQCQQMISQDSRFEMDIINHHGQQQHTQCCQGLQSMNMQCRCEAVNQMVQEMMQHQGWGQQSERMEEMMEKAKNLPDMCNLEPRQCQIHIATFRTAINTVVEEENSQWGGAQQRCQQQFQQKRQQLRQCQQMISQDRSFEMDIINEYGQQQHGQCCQGLQSLDRQCRCEAVNQMMQEMMQHQGQGQQSERMEVMMEKARHLPDMCNLEPRECQIRSPYY